MHMGNVLSHTSTHVCQTEGAAQHRSARELKVVDEFTELVVGSIIIPVLAPSVRAGLFILQVVPGALEGR
jgi:hypothetical protein